MMSVEPAAVAEEEDDDVKLAFVESEIDMDSSQQQDAFGDIAVVLEADNIADIRRNYFDNGVVVVVVPYYNFADNDHKAKV